MEHDTEEEPGGDIIVREQGPGGEAIDTEEEPGGDIIVREQGPGGEAIDTEEEPGGDTLSQKAQGVNNHKVI